ncbi:MAG: leucyl/phenylalanyl-tRNA--protein transferase [Magnetococcales bacterium]|nr:leucyl/phenylalanyl-tRNA--protein transferase [Magnetococcales bacterium]
MPIYQLPREHQFPHPSQAEKEGILAVGGDLSPQRLLIAYSQGIFPWYSKGEPILWWSPDPRFVLDPKALHVPRSLQKTLRRGTYVTTFDCAFAMVIRGCAQVRQETGTWITLEMERAFIRLHRLGLAHSVETWILEEEFPMLVGGVYGLNLGGIFFGESMFSLRPDASKVAFVTLVNRLVAMDCQLVDCQVASDHLSRFGARDIPREEFLSRLQTALLAPMQIGSWR